MTPAGWYADPADPQLIRYWDGAQWTPETKPRPLLPPTPTYVAAQAQPAAPVSGSKKASRTIWKVCGVLLAVFIVGNVVSAVIDDSPRTPEDQTRVSTGNYPAYATPTTTPPEPAAATPQQIITYSDGLAVRITAMTEGPSSNSFDGDGPFTIISFELKNNGTSGTFDAADWFTPYLNFGPSGYSAEDAWLAGTVNGVRSDNVNGSGLIPPKGIVTVNAAYEVSIAQLSPATITPQRPGNRLWTGDFAATFGG